VQSLLDLARHSACRDAARLIEDGNISAALSALEALAAGAFHWRGAVTNGYQQGFFVNALRGYCLEKTGDIVKAYRAYQTSRAYFDDQAAAVQCPEPRLEVFLGLGRTCLVAGRYTDAFNWLDLVRLEASAEPRLAATADRALIRRAIEIGDYHDAITNYVDLRFLLTESEESPHGGGSHIAQPEKSTSTFVRRERIYTPEEYRELAQLYFWTHQDRPGFKTILDGITLLGINNDLIMTDPLFVCFQANVMRANDAEFQRFYDLVGYAIAQARMLKGDEEFIAILCGTRLVMRKTFDWIEDHDDLQAVVARCEEIKRELLLGLRPGRARAAHDARDRRVARAVPGPAPLDDAAQRSRDSSSYFEDQLMRADCLLKNGLHAGAYTCCSNLVAQASPGTNCAGVNPQALAYDGTSMQQAARLGMLLASHARGAGERGVTNAVLERIPLESGCIRADAAVLTLACDDRHITSAHIQPALAALPAAHPAALRFLAWRIDKSIQQGNADQALADLAEYEVRRGTLSVAHYAAWARLLTARDQAAAAFAVLLRGLTRCALDAGNEFAQCCILADLCASTWAWADDAQLANYLRTCRMLCGADLFNTYMQPVRVMQLVRVVLPTEQRLRDIWAMQDWPAAHALLATQMRSSTQAEHDYRRAIVYAALGNTNAALNAVSNALLTRRQFCAALDTNVMVTPGRYALLHQQLAPQVITAAEPERQ